MSPQLSESPVQDAVSKISKRTAKSKALRLTACQDANLLRDTVSDTQLQKLLESTNLGQKIQELRLQRSFSLVRLGKLCELSASYLSQLEMGKVCPTLRNLAHLAVALRVDLAYFFHHGEQSFFRISRENDRIHLALGLRDVPVMTTEDMGGLIPAQNLIPYITEITAGDHGSSFEPELFSGTEFVYLLSGSATAAVAKQSKLLEAKDVLWVDGNTPRQYTCIGEVPARLLVMSFVRRRMAEPDRSTGSVRTKASSVGR